MAKLKSIHKKAQIWGLDLVVAVAIFSISLSIFYFYALNGKAEVFEKIELLSYDAKQISQSILSSGYPEDWNEQNVVEIGLTTDGKLNETKIGRFYNMTQNDYNETKRLLKTSNDYYFFLDENLSFGTTSVRGIGKPDFDLNNFDFDDMINVKRIVVYKNKPVEARFYVWKL